MSRTWWRYVVALALVPVVLFAGPAAHGATATQTDWVGATFNFAGVGVGDFTVFDADCGGSFAMNRDGLGQINVQTSGGYCVGGVDMTPWSCQIFEGGADPCTDFTITFEGSGSCDLVVMEPTTSSHAEDSFSHVAVKWGAESDLAGTCDPSQVCLDAAHEGEDSHKRVCDSIELDPPAAEVPAADCVAGGVVKPANVSLAVKYGSGSWAWYASFDAKIKTGSTGEWRPYVITTDGGTYPLGVVVSGETMGQQVKYGMGVGLTGATATYTVDVRMGPTASTEAGVASSPELLLGVGYIRNQPPGTANPNFSSTYFQLPQTSSANGLLAVSDVTRCSYYWGLKVADLGAVTWDEPLGELPVASGDPLAGFPAPPEPIHEDDPGAEPETEVGFWAAVIALLRGIVAAVGNVISAIFAIGASIVSALTGLVAGIVGGIMDGVTALFVPDSLTLMDEVDATGDAWDDTTIAQWKTSFTDQALTFPGGGCTGVPVDIELPGGVAADFNLGSACSGGVATAAGIVKAISTGALVIFGGIGCLRALGSGFGWSPAIGTKGQA